jgi:protein SCO1/2
MGKPEELYDMVHTENLVLVDTKKESSRFLWRHKKEDIVRLIEDINFL